MKGSGESAPLARRGVLTREPTTRTHGATVSSAHDKKGPGPVNADAVRRLKNIEGQVRGLQKMVEEEKYCVEILTQISAARAALNQVGMLVLKRHVEHCVVDAVKNPDRLAGSRIIDELMGVISKGEL